MSGKLEEDKTVLFIIVAENNHYLSIKVMLYNWSQRRKKKFFNALLVKIGCLYPFEESTLKSQVHFISCV